MRQSQIHQACRSLHQGPGEMIRALVVFALYTAQAFERCNQQALQIKKFELLYGTCPIFACPEPFSLAVLSHIRCASSPAWFAPVALGAAYKQKELQRQRS